MAMDSDCGDDISLTSTVESEQASEYFVDTILAEYEFAEDDIRYLVKWDGYDIHRCTWEPKGNFNNVHETLLEWEEKKQRIAEGKEPAFDVAVWEETCRRLDEKKQERKRRRAAKRREIAASQGKRSHTAAKDAPTVQRITSRKASTASARRPPGPARSLYSDSVHPARQLSGSSTPRPPPPVLFGNSQSAPKTVRPNKILSPDDGKPFNSIYKKWKSDQRAKNKELMPHISQVDIRRPSDWATMPSVKATQPGNSRSLGTGYDSPEQHAPRSALASPQLSHPHPQSPDASIRLECGIWNGSESEQDLVAKRTCSGLAAEVEPKTSKAESNLKTPPTEPRAFVAAKSGPRAPMELDFRDRRPSFRWRHIPHSNPRRWWNQGELFVTLWFGPDKQCLGDARICGMGAQYTAGILGTRSKYNKGKIDIWLRHLCSLDQYEQFCSGMTNTKYANGWIEGFDDTEPHIQKAAETLYSKHKAAIAHIGSKEVLVAYPPGSPPFSFLGDTHQPRGYLTLALRDTLGPVNRLLRISEQYSYNHSAEVNNTFKSGHRESTLTTAPGPRKPPRDFDVAQQSTGQSSTASPTLNVPDMAFSPASGSAMAQPQTNISPVRNSHAPSLSSSIQVSTNTSNVVDCSTPVDSMNLDPHPTQALTPGHNGTEPGAAQVDLNKLFSDGFGITFEKLAAIGGSDKKAQRAKVFYIWYPEDSKVVKDEKDLITRFLRIHTRLLFSNSVNVDWERFTTMVNENNMHGVVLFHESFVEYDKVPQLQKALRRTTGFWKVSLSKPIQYVDRPLHVQRLFPHGGIFLLTEDLIVHEPVAAMIILQWFYEWSKKKYPGLWKIMLRPNILNWLTNQMKLADYSQQSRWLAVHHLVKQLGFCSTSNPLSSYESWEGVVISPPALPKYGFRTADDSLEIPKNCSQEQRNADHLSEFFAGYSLVHAHRFRRFYIITALEPLERWKKWQHVTVSGYQEFFHSHDVKPELIQERLSKGASSALSSTDPTPVSPAPPRSSRPWGTPLSEQQSVSLAPQFASRYGQPYQ
ncbi:putative Chromo domain protein Chp1p [Aspergillus nidulans FGSC A4]|uniref:Chromo domain protein Chp1p, putative (AFU_orthologue AFUA_1G02180) n=1 Tax=Emericella nidulans (strain FGSC A4 / ATCC 38163 / CBS 112.46 / NRRL 194 / M139) TaxID=227321 RepID=C8VTU2_EMENI|nr:hypothetical protein [Aspergillus nidulans FGSC A4]CBF89670.1 TPA: Chromo domain protein Chp1p, putative (AFU_orthologue; AFUA_1G02180) [Aspergillus nidulans FGSC A4]